MSGAYKSRFAAKVILPQIWTFYSYFAIIGQYFHYGLHVKNVHFGKTHFKDPNSDIHLKKTYLENLDEYQAQLYVVPFSL